MGSPLEQYIGSRQKTPSDSLESYISQRASKATDDTGFLAYLGNAAENFVKVEAVKAKIFNPLRDLMGGYNPDPNTEEGRIKAAIDKGDQTSFSDWMNGFKQMWENTSQGVKDAVNHPGEIIGSLKNLSVAQIGKGILQPVIDMAELGSGVSITGNDIEALSPVDKATRVRDIVAFGAAAAVGGGVTGIFEKAAGKAALEGSLALRLARSATVGASAGAAYSAVNQQNADQIITSAILGGGLGLVHAVIPKKAKVTGPDIAKVREMQPETNSVASQVAVINESMKSDDPVNILLKSKVPLQPNIPWKIPGLALDKLSEAESNVPEGFKSVIHIGADGLGKMLVYNPEHFPGPESPYGVDESFFRRTGFLQDEQVTYLGKDNWSVQDAAGEDITLRNESDGHLVDAKRSDIVESVQGQIGLKEDVAQRLYDEWKSTLPKPKGYEEVGLVGPKVSAPTKGGPARAFHGTNADFTEFDGSKSDPNAKYGPGFYFTENPLKASGYTETKGTGSTPNVKIASLNINTPFDADMDHEFDSPEVQHILGTAQRLMPDVDWDYGRDLLQQREESHNLVGADIYKVLSKMVDENGIEAKRSGANKILKAAGYDGITHVGGKAGDTHRVWIAFDKSQIGAPRLEGLGSPVSIANRIPEVEGLELQKHLDGFLQSKGFADNQLRTLRQQIMGRMGQESNAAMAESDRDFVNSNKPTTPPVIETLDDISKHAAAYGFSIKDGNSGVIHIFDDKGRILYSTNSIKSAADFINKSGKPVAPTLDDNPQLSTGGISGSPPIPPDGGIPKYPEDLPFDRMFSPDELEKMNPWESQLRDVPGAQSVTWATKVRDHLGNVDDHYGSKFKDLQENLSEQKNKSNGLAIEPTKTLKGIQKDLAAKPSAYRRILDYIRTSSPAELAAKLNPNEQEFGRILSDPRINLENVFEFRASFEKLQKEYPEATRQGQEGQEYNQKVAAITDKYKMDNVNMQALETVNRIKASPNSALHTGNIFKYSRALRDMDGSQALSKGEFAAKSGMNGREITAANQLTAQTEKLKSQVGVTSNIYDILDHAKRYYKGNVAAALEDFAGDAESRNYTKLLKQSWFSAYDDNPFKIQARLIKGVSDINSGFADGLEAAYKAIPENQKIVSDATRDERGVSFSDKIGERAANVTKRMISDIQGKAALSDTATNQVTKRWFERFKLNGKPISEDGRVIEGWSSAIGRAFNFKYLDGRPQLGISHLFVSTQFSLISRGVDFTARVLKAGGTASEADFERLQQRGVFSSVAPYSAFTPDADVTSYGSQIGQFVDAAEKKLFKATLLPSVFDRSVTGVYTVTEGDVISGMKDFSEGKITQQEFDKKVFLSRYDVSTIKKFRGLANAGKAEDAAHYLGRAAVDDLIGSYGKGNSPTGWGSAWGKLLVQYGQFSRFKWGAVSRLITRGTIQERIQSATLLGASLYGAKKLSDATGLDLTRLSPLYDMFWLKSVAAGTVSDIINAVSGSGLEQTLAQHRLKKQFFGTNVGNYVDFPGAHYIPLPNVVQDITNGINDIGQGNVGTGTAELMGFRRQPRR
jgi:hypothetical protein